MKSLLALSFCVVTFFTLPASASNYPAEAYHQRVRIFKDGPMTAVLVSNLCMTKWLLAYDRQSPLSYTDDEQIEAYAFSSCWVDDQLMSRQKSKIILGRDWQGSGAFISAELDPGDLLNRKCRTTLDRDVEVAFKRIDSEQWDSNFSQNYRLPHVEMYRQDSFDTHKGGCTAINTKAYEYILNELRR